MATDKPTPQWRNFAAWSAVGAIFYVLAVWGISSFLHEDGAGAMFRSKEVAAQVGLGLIFSMACVGFSSRKRPIGLRTIRNFVISSASAVVVCLLVLWGLRTFVGTDALGASEWVAAAVGSAFVIFAFLGILGVAIAYRGGHFMQADTADQLRERGRLFVYSYVWMAACGLLLIVLMLARPEGVLSPAAAVVGALVLIAVLTVLGIAVWRLMDELDRTLSHEAGNMAFYLILALGGGWAMLAQLGFVAGPAPLDWLTLFTVLMFVASFVAVGRRRLLAR
ncbi:hypothetical protein [Pseudoxanthomonas wuyuanensis]